MNTDNSQMQAEFKERMDYDDLMNCMRCGFCLPTCPTYIESGNDETQSPRGRIALMKGVVYGEIELDSEVKRSLDMCLGCRACEPVCPSGVKYGQLLEQARDIIYQNQQPSFPVTALRKFVFHHLFPHQDRIIGLMSLLRLYQKTGMQKLARKTGLLNLLLPEHLHKMEKILPEIPSRTMMRHRPHHIHPSNKKRRKVAFFSGCLMNTMFLPINEATLKLLAYADCEIVIPKRQNCCGALHGHGGEKEIAKSIAKQNIRAFENEEVDHIITNAGGCGAFLTDYTELLKDEADWKNRASRFSDKITDISRLLVDLELDKELLTIEPRIVTYQDSCHLRNGQHTIREPRKLLRSIEGAVFHEMKDAERCCGSAGIYNITEPEMSMQILDYKMEQTKATGATVIVTTNPGCLLQMKLGIEKMGLTEQVSAVHLVELLLEAYENGLKKCPKRK
ncbi:(Fe-S)-binding protein [Sediminibacillus massiliensis]|uniref:(Fe-S)-binding protein n=1 Tax=Sediminibacillus massiliensis TaxID=1926277 RepID=UPI0009887B45|nr:(Fe-S)-binding protein [Sediminibacillus massiliensis]